MVGVANSMFKGTFSMKIWVERNSKETPTVTVKPANVLGPDQEVETPDLIDTSTNTDSDSSSNTNTNTDQSSNSNSNSDSSSTTTSNSDDKGSSTLQKVVLEL